MDDEGIPVRTLFRGEDLLDGLGVEGIRAEAVDGFGGEGYCAAFAEDAGSLRDAGGGVEMEGGGHFGYGSGFGGAKIPISCCDSCTGFAHCGDVYWGACRLPRSN